MRQIISNVIQNYGSTVDVVFHEKTQTVRAFLQLVTSKSWQNMERMIPSGGQIKRGQFLYIGPADVPVQEALSLRCGGKRFRVRRADVIHFQDEPLFLWGLCVEGGPDDPWSESLAA